MNDAQLELSDGSVELADDVELVTAVELIDAVGESDLLTAADLSTAAGVAVTAGTDGLPLEQRNLFGEAERIAARAGSASTRKQYAVIYRSFGDWLQRELGRPPVVGDLTADSMAAYARHLATVGGRGGRPAALATQRVYISMIRALARACAREDHADGVQIPRHLPGPPETLTNGDYANLLRVPDRRSLSGKRDYALLRVLGDCGLRSAEIRGLCARDLRRPRSNSRHHRLFVRGKGGREREVPVPELVQQALEAWLKVHPLTRGVALRDDDPIFVRIGRHQHEDPVALSAMAVARIVTGVCEAAGVPERLAHPHALRGYYGTHLLEVGVPIHEVSARLGHGDLRTTARYASPRPERVDDVAELLDRAHQAERRQGPGR